jgi:hypothetical protein
VPDRYIAITGVLVALIFCLVLGGLNPDLQTVSEKPKSQQGLWYLSGPRWTTEAFVINTIRYYQYVPDGTPFAGAPYANVDNYLNKYSYSFNDFALCMWATLLDGFFWGFIALILMAVFNLEKKK